MNCPSEKQLADFVDQKDDATQHTSVQAHLDTCEGCRVAVDHFGQSMSHLMTVPLSMTPEAEARLKAGAPPAMKPASKSPARERSIPPVPPEPPAEIPKRGPHHPHKTSRSSVKPPPTAMGGTQPKLDQHMNIDRFIVLQKLASDNASTTYEAYDPKERQAVTLKVLHTAAPSDTLAAAKLLYRISHPAVAPIVSIGEVDRDVFVAMQRSPGTSLAEWMRGPHSHEEIIDVFRQLGSALIDVHEASLLYRDFSPETAAVDSSGHPKLTDITLTMGKIGEAASAVLRSSPYAAPEVKGGKPPTALSDQYSFCAVLHEAVYGSPPKGANAAPEAGGMGRHIQIPKKISEVLEKGLSASPEERFASMGALLKSLPRKFTQKQRMQIIGAAASAVVLGGAIAGYSFIQSNRVSCTNTASYLNGIWDDTVKSTVTKNFKGSKRPYADTASTQIVTLIDGYAKQWTTERTDACEDTHVRSTEPTEVYELRTRCLDDEMQHLKAVTKLLSESRADTIDTATQVIATLPAITACNDVASLRRQMQPANDKKLIWGQSVEQLARASGLLAASRKDEAKGVLTPVVKSSRDAGFKALLGAAWTIMGQIDADGGELDGARKLLDDSILALETAGDDRRLTAAWIARARLADQQKQYAEAMQALAHAEAVGDRASADQNARGRLLATKANILLHQDQLADAKRAADSAVTAFEKVGESGVSQTVEALGLLAQIDQRLGNAEAAFKSQKRAVEMIEKAVGNQHPVVAKTLGQLARAQQSMGRYDESLKLLERVVKINEGVFGAKAEPTTDARMAVAENLMALEQFDDAIDVLERCTAAYRETLGAEHPSTAKAMAQGGYAQLALKKLDAAETTFRGAWTARAKQAKTDDTLKAVMQREKADVLMAREKCRPAADAFAEAAQLFAKSAAATSLSVAEALSGQAKALLCMMKANEAVGVGEKSLEAATKTPGDTMTLAMAQRVLGQALWVSGQDKDRSKQLLTAAKQGYEKSGRAKSQLAEFEAWAQKQRVFEGTGVADKAKRKK